jgi:lysozyme family protein
MIKVVWGDTLKKEYQKLFDTCKVHDNRKGLADIQARRIYANKPRYEKIAGEIGCPWWFVGVIHMMECGLSFEKHLHNGDKLTGRTTHVPAGRPATGNPPFTFEQSALDALTFMGFKANKDWSTAYVLYRLEGFNGYGYRQYHPTVLSPYLWSFTNHYVKGKYVADGKWDGETVSAQLGIAAVLKRLQELGYAKL